MSTSPPTPTDSVDPLSAENDPERRAFAAICVQDIIDRHNQRWNAGCRDGLDFDIHLLLLAAGHPITKEPS